MYNDIYSEKFIAYSESDSISGSWTVKQESVKHVSVYFHQDEDDVNEFIARSNGVIVKFNAGVTELRTNSNIIRVKLLQLKRKYPHKVIFFKTVPGVGAEMILKDNYLDFNMPL